MSSLVRILHYARHWAVLVLYLAVVLAVALIESHTWCVHVRITHYRRTYHNFRDGKAHGAKGETDQFHVEPDVPAVDEELLQEETFFSLSGSITKVRENLLFSPCFMFCSRWVRAAQTEAFNPCSSVLPCCSCCANSDCIPLPPRLFR